VTFLSFARSGAEIRGGLLSRRSVEIDGLPVSLDGWIKDLGQVEEARRTIGSRRIDVLLISIGGNDLGFSGSLTDLVKKDHWLSKLIEGGGGNDKETREKIEREADALIAGRLSKDFDDLSDAIRARLNPRHVVIAEYPTGLFTQRDENGRTVDGDGCEIFSSSTFDLDIVARDGQMVRELGKKLNHLIREKADRFGWTVISGVEREFDGRGYCAAPRYFVHAEESCLRQGDFEGTMHPNAKGHEALRDCIVRAVRPLLTRQTNWLEPVLNVMMR
jgi:hypothetical protein